MFNSSPSAFHLAVSHPSLSHLMLTAPILNPSYAVPSCTAPLSSLILVAFLFHLPLLQLHHHTILRCRHPNFYCNLFHPIFKNANLPLPSPCLLIQVYFNITRDGHKQKLTTILPSEVVSCCLLDQKAQSWIETCIRIMAHDCTCSNNQPT